jgi:hypothetical protein
MQTGRSLIPTVALVALMVTEPTVGQQPTGNAQVLWQFEAGG